MALNREHLLKRPRVAALALLLSLAAGSARANAVAPALFEFVILPLFCLFLVLIVIVEMFMARRIMGVSELRAWRFRLRRIWRRPCWAFL